MRFFFCPEWSIFSLHVTLSQHPLKSLLQWKAANVESTSAFFPRSLNLLAWGSSPMIFLMLPGGSNPWVWASQEPALHRCCLASDCDVKDVDCDENNNNDNGIIGMMWKLIHQWFLPGRSQRQGCRHTCTCTTRQPRKHMFHECWPSIHLQSSIVTAACHRVTVFGISPTPPWIPPPALVSSSL